MTAIPVPLRLDRIQKSLYSVLAVACAPNDVFWTDEVPQQSLSAAFVALNMIAGPAPYLRQKRRGTLLQPADTIDITVNSAVVGKRYAIVLNHFSYYYDAQAEDGVADIAAALVALVNADVAETATASDLGGGDYRITADFLGGIRYVSLVGDQTAGTPSLNSQHVLLVEGTQTMLVNVQAYSKEREIRNGAATVIQQCYAALQSEDLVEELRAYGTGIWGLGTPVNLNAIAGAHWETRESVDVTLAAVSTWVRPVSVFDSATITQITKDQTLATVDVQTFTV